jgi:PTS system ascorbate-specific IIA component
MLLKDIVDQNHAHFIEKADGWEDSIRQSCKMLIADGTVTKEYPEEIIAAVREIGPYIVLMPGLALPHSAKGSANAKGTAIAFMKVNQEVAFDGDNPDKKARVFFTLAAIDTDSHLKNMRKLWKMLTDEALVADLQSVESVDDLLALDKKYSK